jgi:hypothetical protein
LSICSIFVQKQLSYTLQICFILSDEERTPPTNPPPHPKRAVAGSGLSIYPSGHAVQGIPPGAHYTAPPFDPVPVQPRRDGWTPERQRGFIEALAATACVEDAARAVGMSATSAYNLCARPDAVAFRAAWDAALDFAAGHLKAAVFSRAIHGVPVPHYYKGELVGEHRRYNDRLAMFVMNHYGMGDADEVRDRSVRYFRHVGWLADGDEVAEDESWEE